MLSMLCCNFPLVMKCCTVDPLSRTKTTSRTALSTLIASTAFSRSSCAINFGLFSKPFTSTIRCPGKTWRWGFAAFHLASRLPRMMLVSCFRMAIVPPLTSTSAPQIRRDSSRWSQLKPSSPSSLLSRMMSASYAEGPSRCRLFDLQTIFWRSSPFSLILPPNVFESPKLKMLDRDSACGFAGSLASVLLDVVLAMLGFHRVDFSRRSIAISTSRMCLPNSWA
mmetsp:Transcript_27294/g.59316  ORF Transcript_27294/g.59316 Transcript_27294/m.59316 type:complete len:223 (+) Transcript_27294:199-867(+)